MEATFLSIALGFVLAAVGLAIGLHLQTAAIVKQRGGVFAWILKISSIGLLLYLVSQVEDGLYEFLAIYAVSFAFALMAGALARKYWLR